MKILLFGGTSEGRRLAQWLHAHKIPFLLSVATDYGASLVDADLPVHVGRLDGDSMKALIQSEGITHVIDATHPYAAVVTRTIGAVCQEVGLPNHRLLREDDTAENENWLHASSAHEAGKVLQTLSGNVLLTVGAKELDAYAVPGLLERCYPRILPSLDSLGRALSLSFPAKQIICMQGPFSVELNVALLRQYDIQILVTKCTGSVGGFWDKVEAARTVGATLLVIDRPSVETGYTMEELQDKIVGWMA